jgi:heme/copper-type cytochrome/quinol oxidase subunit 1
MVGRFHYVAYAAGGLLLLTLAAMALLGPRPRGLAARSALVATMLAVAIYSGVVVLGRIDAIQRDVGGLPSRLPAADARRVRFDELHQLSTRLMLVNVVGALALLFWEARE